MLERVLCVCEGYTKSPYLPPQVAVSTTSLKNLVTLHHQVMIVMTRPVTSVVAMSTVLPGRRSRRDHMTQTNNNDVIIVYVVLSGNCW